MTLTLALALALTLALALALTLALALALTLTLALTLARSARIRAALPLTLPLARAGTALSLSLTLPLALLPLTGRLTASVREIAPGILQSRGRCCQVASRGDAPIRARERLSQSIQRLASPSRVALRQALGGIAQCRSGRSIRL